MPLMLAHQKNFRRIRGTEHDPAKWSKRKKTMIREGFLSLILLNCCFSFNILPRFKSYNTPFQNVRACPLTLKDTNFHRSKVSLSLSVEPQAHQQIIDEIKTMSIKDIKVILI